MSILVANDGSQNGEKAVRGALDLARRLGVGVTMVCVEARERFPAVVDLVPEAQRDAPSPFDPIVEADAALARGLGVPFEAEILAGHPVERILDVAERGEFELLVVGRAGHSALYEHLLGSVAHRLLALSSCSVLVVK